MFIFIKNQNSSAKVLLDDNGKETELKALSTMDLAMAHGKAVAGAMGCEFVPHELTIAECELAAKEDRATKHHVSFMIRSYNKANADYKEMSSKWSHHSCPSCPRCGDRS
jgi:alpha-D-ribose 1-methylphosphonate 5-triphosphate synthase subunit PhnG